MNISKIQNIHISDFDYPLPDSKIARHPSPGRDDCRMIRSDASGEVSHHDFAELPELVAGAFRSPLMVFNETKVINARMEFHKATGSRIEIFLLEPAEPADYAVNFASTAGCVWYCLVGNRKKWKQGALERELALPGGETTILSARVADMPGRDDGSIAISFSWDNPKASFAAIVEAAGYIPIPPYLGRDSEESDADDYQTVYSRVMGSVAAPTAGLHFTERTLAGLQSRGVKIDKVTLHVGAGTFRPVKSALIGGHAMHTETVCVPLRVIEDVISALQEDRDVVAVGTTSVRTLESLPYFGLLAMRGADVAEPETMHVGQWDAYADDVVSIDTLSLLRALAGALRDKGLDSLHGDTQIMIAPGFRWRIVSGMVTNFHQPQSTLLLLVSSFLEGPDADGAAQPQWRRLYDAALEADYRFLSYGDACLLQPKTPSHKKC